MKTALFICILASTISASAFAATKSGPACYRALADNCGFIHKKVASTVLKCKNEHSVVALQGLASLFCSGDGVLPLWLIKIASKAKTENEAACILYLTRNFDIVTEDSYKDCL